MTAALEARGLTKRYPVRSGALGRRQRWIRAVESVSLVVPPGRTLGVVGESGSGKSTLARLLVGLEPATAGSVWLHGREIPGSETEGLRRLRRDIQMVFQETRGSLHPTLSVRETLAEPLRAHDLARGRRGERVDELLAMVGLAPSLGSRRAHELSGGERQRVGIARALATEPSVIVADEPVSALDVSVRAQIVNVFARLQDRLGISLVFIAHDFAVVEQIAHRIAVMHEGRIVEEAEPRELLESPRHPQTLALVEAARVGPRNICPSGA